jgi:hypothetical protein
MGLFSGTINNMEKKKENNNKKASYKAKFKKYKQSLRDKGASKKHKP